MLPSRLNAHAVLLAEGLPAESYLDTGNRGQFANGQPDLADVQNYRFFRRRAAFA